LKELPHHQLNPHLNDTLVPDYHHKEREKSIQYFLQKKIAMTTYYKHITKITNKTSWNYETN
jgi:peptidase E